MRLQFFPIKQRNQTKAKTFIVDQYREWIRWLNSQQIYIHLQILQFSQSHVSASKAHTHAKHETNGNCSCYVSYSTLQLGSQTFFLFIVAVVGF